MILDDIADVINEARRTKTAKEIARLFSKERKWVFLPKRAATYV